MTKTYQICFHCIADRTYHRGLTSYKETTAQKTDWGKLEAGWAEGLVASRTQPLARIERGGGVEVWDERLDERGAI